MRLLRRFLHRMTAWTKRRRDEERLGEEIENHIGLQTAENIRAGLSPAEARRQAVLKFGASEAMKEGYRDQLGLPSLETFIRDARYALRRLRNAPAFTTATGYFGVIGNRVLRGRGISQQDTQTSRHVAVINEAFAQKFFKNEDPIGKHFGQNDIGSERDYEIVGVAKDALYLTFNFGKPMAPFFFVPEAQHDFLPEPGSTDANPGSHFLQDIVIVTKPGANLSDAQVRQAMASVDPNLPIISIHTLKEQVTLHFTQQRLIAQLTSFFGLLSLLLASIGLYGVTAYNAGRRTSEIGVRMALGANRSHVVSLVLRGAFALVALGLIVGLPLTFAAGKFLGSQLYGMNPYNPVVTLIAAVSLGLAGFVAALIPALGRV